MSVCVCVSAANLYKVRIPAKSPNAEHRWERGARFAMEPDDRMNRLSSPLRLALRICARSYRRAY